MVSSYDPLSGILDDPSAFLAAQERSMQYAGVEYGKPSGFLPPGVGLGGMVGVVGPTAVALPGAGVTAALAPVAAAIPAIAPVVAAAAPVIAAGGAIYALLQALGLGEGGGIGGINLLGGDDSFIPGTNIALGGPGLPEPAAKMVVKEWNTGTAQFYQLTDGRIAVYSKKKKRWTAYRPQKMAVIGKRIPSHKTLTRLRHNLKRHKDDAITIIKLTAPKRLEGHTRSSRYGPIRAKR